MISIVEDIVNNGLSLLDASKKYDVSVSKLRKYITSLKNSDLKDEKKLYETYISRNYIDKKSILIDIILNDLLLEDASLKYGCSLSTLKKYIASLKNSSDFELKKLYDDYQVVAKRHNVDGVSKGGRNSVRKSSISSLQINKIYRLIIEDDYTLRQIEALFGFKKSTVYDLLMKNLSDDEIKVLSIAFRKHKEFSLNDYECDVENTYEFHNVGSEISRRRTRG